MKCTSKEMFLMLVNRCDGIQLFSTFFRMFQQNRKWCRRACSCPHPRDMFPHRIRGCVALWWYDHTNCYAFPFAIASYFYCIFLIWFFHAFRHAIHALR